MTNANESPERTGATEQSRRNWSQRLVAGESVDSTLLEELWADPDALVARGAMMKNGDRCTLVRIDRDGRSFVLKRYNRRDVLHSIVHWFMRSRAQWCWTNAKRLRAIGLNTPANVAMLETRFGPLRDRSFLLTEYINGRMLVDVVRDPALTKDRLDALADEMARIWSALGKARLTQRDMKATNFLVDDENRIWLIDLDGVRVQRIKWLFDRRRRKDWARFMRNWADVPEAARVFRVRIDTTAQHDGA